MATDLFQLFAGRRGEMIAATNELILAFSMVGPLMRGSSNGMTEGPYYSLDTSGTLCTRDSV